MIICVSIDVQLHAGHDVLFGIFICVLVLGHENLIRPICFSGTFFQKKMREGDFLFLFFLPFVNKNDVP